MLSSIFDAFVKESPISIMMRGLMESVFRPQRLEEIFESHSKLQYTRELLFSSLVDLLSLIVDLLRESRSDRKFKVNDRGD